MAIVERERGILKKNNITRRLNIRRHILGLAAACMCG